jgi:hypothetical protein
MSDQVSHDVRDLGEGRHTRSRSRSNLTLRLASASPSSTLLTALTSSITLPSLPTSTVSGSSPIRPSSTAWGVMWPMPVAAREP